jgi:hypothetical protein
MIRNVIRNATKKRHGFGYSLLLKVEAARTGKNRGRFWARTSQVIGLGPRMLLDVLFEGIPLQKQMRLKEERVKN